MESITNYISLHHHAILLGITVLTSLDTTNALADVIAGRYNQFNTELVDINHLRTEKLKLEFNKMHSCGNDYIFFNNMDNRITCPESLAINFADRHYAIGGDGIILIEKSDIADAKVRVFNRDGSDAGMAANPMRIAAKYLYDNGMVSDDTVTLDCGGEVAKLTISCFNNEASSVCVYLDSAETENVALPALATYAKYGGHDTVAHKVKLGKEHLVTFLDKIDDVDFEDFTQELAANGAIYEGTDFVECVRVVNNVTLRMRVFGKVNGETWSCGTAAAAAAIAAIDRGDCDRTQIITVKLKGGDLFVKINEDGTVEIDGPVKQAFKGIIEI